MTESAGIGGRVNTRAKVWRKRSMNPTFDAKASHLKRRRVVGHKADGRSVYDQRAKAELVALCLQPGASLSRLAREFGVNANQVCRWLRERGHVRRCRHPGASEARSTRTGLSIGPP